MDGLFSYLDSGPQCIVALDGETGHPTRINSTFEKLMGPLYKFSNYAFSNSAEKDVDKDRMREAVDSVMKGGDCSKRVRNVEMLTLSEGMPIRRHFDWTVGKGSDGTVLLFGDRCNETDEESIARDAELIDFFDNAPIALHWLSGDGIVLWANKTEMNVLGYSPEEYIGQPVMKFCPDEEDLVLEIFKQLGSGNTIKDVPVRFRTKDGKLVHLLIDSNIRYNPDGTFGHTRCFIRDDTGRKVQEARAKLLLEETKRSLVNMDNFMSRTLHHILTPLHVMQNTGELLMEKLVKHVLAQGDSPAAAECREMLEETNEHVSETFDMIKNTLELVRLEQGKVLDVGSDLVDVRALGVDILDKAESPAEGVRMRLIIERGAPAIVTSDAELLERIVLMLLKNANGNTAAPGGKITLSIGLHDDRCTFTVTNTSTTADGDDGDDSSLLDDAGKFGTLPKIFQRYQEELAEDEVADFNKAADLRASIDAKLASCRTDLLGVGLSLTYHLVLALGGELRYFSGADSGEGLNKYWFSLPSRFSRHSILQGKILESEVIERGAQFMVGRIENPPLDVPTTEPEARGWESPVKERVKDDPTLAPQKHNEAIASRGIYKANDTPLILVVEDTPICARLLCKQLSHLNFAVAHAENGQVAIDMLLESTPGTYSLVLMDIRMPVMDGFEATRIIKEELELEVPVVALTGETSGDFRTKCDEIGFDEFCTKPMNSEELRDIVYHFADPEYGL